MLLKIKELGLKHIELNKMEILNPYCEFVKNKNDKDLDKQYHDNEYGFQIDCDNEIFGRLILEINQAGLSWTTILKKRNEIKIAFSNFEILKVSKFNEEDITNLLNNEKIIRNKLKIKSIIYNANQILKIQKEFKSFKKWLDLNKGKNLEEWIKLFKVNFKFTGGEITKEFLISLDYIGGAHSKNCPIYNKSEKSVT